MEEKVYKSNKISLELLKQLKDAAWLKDLSQRFVRFFAMIESHVWHQISMISFFLAETL